MPDPQKLSGTERSAILILALGERKAADVLRQMEPKEVQRIGAAMTRLGDISRDQVNAVLAEFGIAVQSDSMLTVGVEDYLRNVMVSALGEQKARGILDRVLDGDDDTLGNLKWMDPKAIAAVLKDEHPQVVALALASMEQEQAALVLALLPSDQRADIVSRVATLDELQPGALSEVRAILEHHFYRNVDTKSARVGGIKTAAGIVGRLDPALGNGVLEELREADEALEQQIQDNLILFESLVDVDDKGLQAILREITSEVLLVALKGADQVVRDRFFKNMSKRAAEMLREDMQLRGPVRLAEVEEAQKEMLGAARRLAEAGVIRLGKSGGDFVE